MESISYRYGDQSRHGGMDITLSLTPDEVAALGLEEAGTLADWFDSALWALALFRNGSNSRGPAEIDPAAADVTADQMAHVITHLDRNLLPRLQGIRDATVRRHQELGGSINSLAAAMDVAKSTAQSRRNAVITKQPSDWETWAVDGGPQDRRTCHACGWPGTQTNPLGSSSDGYLIHASHTEDPKSGFHGAQLSYGTDQN